MIRRIEAQIYVLGFQALYFLFLGHSAREKVRPKDSTHHSVQEALNTKEKGSGFRRKTEAGRLNHAPETEAV